MADATTDLVLRLGSVTGLSIDAVNGDNATPKGRAGTISFLVDAFGYRVVQYVKNLRGSALAMGNLASKVANTAVNNQTGTVATSATTTGLTADAHIGRLAYVLDDAGGAGAAPEGETTVIGGNTTTVLTFDPQMPLSTALANGDDLVLISNWQATAAADGDLAVNVLGVVMGNAGISNNNFGWVQREGYCPNVDTTAAALVAGDPVVADAAQIGAFGSDGQELWVGVTLAAQSSDKVARITPINLKLHSCAGPGTAP